MKYYYADAYKKIEGRKRYKDITEKEKQESFIGRIILMLKNYF